MKPLLRREQAWTDAKSKTKYREGTYGGVFTIAPNEQMLAIWKYYDNGEERDNGVLTREGQLLTRHDINHIAVVIGKGNFRPILAFQCLE